jgi:hypothetical protein
MTAPPTTQGIAPRLEEALRPFLKGDLPVQLKILMVRPDAPHTVPLVRHW